MIGLSSAVTVAVAHQNGSSGDATHIRVKFESYLRVYFCCESHSPCSRGPPGVVVCGIALLHCIGSVVRDSCGRWRWRGLPVIPAGVIPRLRDDWKS